MKIVNFKLIRTEQTNKKGKSQSLQTAKIKLRTESLSHVDLNIKKSFILIKKIKFLQPNKSLKSIQNKSYLLKVSNEVSFTLYSVKQRCTEGDSQFNMSKTSSNFYPVNAQKKLDKNNNNISLIKPWISNDNNKNNLVQKENKKLNSSMSPLKAFKEDTKKFKIVTSKENDQFTYIILPGNNSDLIRKCLGRRLNWKEAGSKFSSVYNLKWGQSHYSMDYNQLSEKTSMIKIVNHFEFELEISNKKQMFMNLIEYCDTNQLDAFKFIPLTIIIKIETTNLDQNFENFKKLFYNTEKYVNYPRCKYSELFQIMESSCILQNSDININHLHYSNKNLWIIKPPDQFGGKNITVTGNFEDIEKLMSKYQQNLIEEKKEEESQGWTTIIIQKYIERPLLYKGRKFDIRMWVLINYDLNVYLFREGHLKLSSLNYNTETNDRYVHITNYSIQKYNRNFEKFENGNELSFQDFQNYLNIKYNSSVNIYNDIYPKFIEIIKISTKSVGNKINKKNRKYSFVILGYDFLIDEDFNAWLLEINKNPGLSESSPIIKTLLPRMIDNCLNLTIDTLFKTEYNKQKSSFHVDNYNDEENLWLYVCNIEN